MILTRSAYAGLGASLVIAATAAPSALAAPKPPPAPSVPLTVSLATSAGIVNYGGTATLSGAVAGTGNVGQTVQLEIDQYPYDTFTGTGKSVTTDANGSFSFGAVAIPQNSRYQVTLKGKSKATSPAVTVRVRSRVSRNASRTLVKRGSRTRLYGTLKGAAPGTTMAIQRRTSTGGWTTVTTTKAVADTTTQSKYSKYVTVKRKTTYRVNARVTTGRFLPGISRSITIRVK